MKGWRNPLRYSGAGQDLARQQEEPEAEEQEVDPREQDQRGQDLDKNMGVKDRPGRQGKGRNEQRE